jgi:hypothetical protein
MPLEDSMDRGRRDIDLVVSLQEEADPKRPVLALPADLEDQSDDVWRRGERMMPRSSRPVPKAGQTILAVPMTPAIEERP